MQISLATLGILALALPIVAHFWVMAFCACVRMLRKLRL